MLPGGGQGAEELVLEEPIREFAVVFKDGPATADAASVRTTGQLPSSILGSRCIGRQPEGKAGADEAQPLRRDLLRPPRAGSSRRCASPRCVYSSGGFQLVLGGGAGASGGAPPVRSRMRRNSASRLQGDSTMGSISS